MRHITVQKQIIKLWNRIYKKQKICFSETKKQIINSLVQAYILQGIKSAIMQSCSANVQDKKKNYTIYKVKCIPKKENYQYLKTGRHLNKTEKQYWSRGHEIGSKSFLQQGKATTHHDHIQETAQNFLQHGKRKPLAMAKSKRRWSPWSNPRDGKGNQSPWPIPGNWLTVA